MTAEKGCVTKSWTLGGSPTSRTLGMEEAMTTVSTADLWAAIDALDALPETHNTDWYKRLVEAAEAATQAELIAKGRIETH